jgi:hypothetical protein
MVSARPMLLWIERTDLGACWVNCKRLQTDDYKRNGRRGIYSDMR